MVSKRDRLIGVLQAQSSTAKVGVKDIHSSVLISQGTLVRKAGKETAATENERLKDI